MTVGIPPYMVEQLLTELKKWSHILQMDHWKYEISGHNPANPKHEMECVTNLKRRHSSIRLRGDTTFQVRDLLHEMVHPILEPIRAEHNMQMRSLETDRDKEYKERILHEVEIAVDHLAKVIYDQQSELEMYKDLLD